MAFFKLSSKWRLKEWRNEPRFLDLRTLTFALRNEAYSLLTACEAFDVSGKLDYSPTGKVSPEEISYCREDVAATARLLNADVPHSSTQGAVVVVRCLEHLVVCVVGFHIALTYIAPLGLVRFRQPSKIGVEYAIQCFRKGIVVNRHRIFCHTCS